MNCYSDMMENSLEEKLEQWVGKTITVYLEEMDVTGLLRFVGNNYLVLQLQENQKREVFIPIYAIIMVVSGEPLETTETTNTSSNIIL